MANIIKPKRSNTAAKVPTTSDLASGELGVNMADKKTYINNGTQVVQIGAGELSGLGDVSITTPSNGQSLVYNGTVWVNQAGSGSGDVTGPVSSTDNALVRFDGTTGKVIQNSTATLDDNGNLINVNSVGFDTTPATVPTTDGTMSWDDGDGVPSVLLKGGNTTLQIGTQEYARVYNDSGSTLTKGQVVYISGAQGNRVAVKLAKADVEATSFGTIGLVAESIANGAEGFIIVSGALYKLNTTGLTAGATVYLSPTTAGALTTTKPQAPNQLVVLGWIERVDNVVGSIYVKIDNGYELDELHDVQVTSPASGNLLIYDASTTPIGVWKNANLTAGTGISITNGAGSITVTNSAPDQVVSISGTSPVSVSGTYPSFTVSMTQSSGSVNGWLSSTDWSTFNGKQAAYTNLTSIGSLANGTGWLYNNGSGTFSYSTPTKTDVGLGNVTNDAQTKAAIVPNTTPTAGQILVGNAGGTAYAPVSASGDATLASTGAITLATVNSNVGSFTNANITVDAKGRITAASNGTASGGTVTSVSGTGNVNGLTLTGTVTTSGSLTLGGNLTIAADMIYDTFTATASQTTFTPSQTYTSGKIEVYVNGVKMRNGSDVTVTSGTSVVFAIGLAVGSLVDLVYPI